MAVRWFLFLTLLISNCTFVRTENETHAVSMESQLCRICWCRRDATIGCEEPNTLSTLNLNDTADVDKYKNTTSITVRDQPQFKTLGQASLRKFLQLRQLTIVDCGLRFIDLDAFKYNRNLVKLDLRNNQLSFVSWKPFADLFAPEINLDKNPLSCDCGNKWIADAVEGESAVKNGTFFDSNWPQIESSSVDKLTCRDVRNVLIPLKKYNFGNCYLPIVHTSKKLVHLNEHESVDVNCSATGNPTPLIKWNVTQLTSKVVLSESGSNWQTLTIQSVQGSDSGEVSCLAENMVGRVRQNLRILVNVRPTVTRLELLQRFHWCIYYESTGYPAPKRTWLFKGKQLLLPTEDMRDESYNGLNGCLTIKTGGLNQEGTYTLVATNLLGSANRSTSVRFHYQNLTQMQFLEPGVPVPPLKLPYDPPSLNSAEHFLDDNRKPNRDETQSSPALTENRLIVTISITFATITATVLLAYFVFWARAGRLGRGALTLGMTNESLINTLIGFVRVLPGTGNRNDKQLEIFTVENFPLNDGHVTANPQYAPQSLPGEEITDAPERADDQTVPHSSFTDDKTDVGCTLIPSSCLCTIKELGEGFFGKVYLAEYVLSPSEEPEKILVAVKVLKLPNEESFKDFKRESIMLSSLQHANIVKYYGACVDQTPSKMVFEYMEQGDLNEFLRKREPDIELLEVRRSACHQNKVQRPTGYSSLNADDSATLSLLSLLEMAKHISSGMQYLASKHCVHRDLATRNCLIDRDNVVKIADFGLSRNIYKMNYYKVRGRPLLPVRWMSPESIVYHKFTIESDVWSFGVVLWELFSFGKQPWYGHSNQEVIDLVADGEILSCPECCPNEVYRLMLECWRIQPHQRITMKAADDKLFDLCSTKRDREVGAKNDFYLKLLPPSPSVKTNLAIEQIL